jgi:hypothetical protein
MKFNIENATGEEYEFEFFVLKKVFQKNNLRNRHKGMCRIGRHQPAG